MNDLIFLSLKTVIKDTDFTDNQLIELFGLLNKKYSVQTGVSTGNSKYRTITLSTVLSVAKYAVNTNNIYYYEGDIWSINSKNQQVGSIEYNDKTREFFITQHVDFYEPGALSSFKLSKRMMYHFLVALKSISYRNKAPIEKFIAHYDLEKEA